MSDENTTPDLDVNAAAVSDGAYTVLGGADFGAGLWHLTRSRAQRELLVKAVGPVWEANHVWLIFTLVVLWTGFPDAFAPIMETLYVPLALAAIGIVLRGSGFAFGHTLGDVGAQRAHVVFAVSSLITPFFLGCVVGAIAAGEVEAGGSGNALGWIGPLPILVGVLFVASCAYIAAVFLLDDCRRAGDEELSAYFLRRSIAAAVVAGALAARRADRPPRRRPRHLRRAVRRGAAVPDRLGDLRARDPGRSPPRLVAGVAAARDRRRRRARRRLGGRPVPVPAAGHPDGCRRGRRRGRPDRADRRLHRRPRDRRPVTGAAVQARPAPGARVSPRRSPIGAPGGYAGRR